MEGRSKKDLIMIHENVQIEDAMTEIDGME
jgi:hypothetical protein